MVKMENYNAPKDEGYKVSNSYRPVKVNNSSYGREQTASLPIYETKQEQPRVNRKSKCPRGAPLDSIGSCCGMACTRACAVSD